MIAAIELAKQLRESQALVDDLENQIGEGLAGMDQAEGRVAELSDLIMESAPVSWVCVGGIDGAQLASEWERRASQAISGDGSAYADVVREAERRGMMRAAEIARAMTGRIRGPITREVADAIESAATEEGE